MGQEAVEERDVRDLRDGRDKQEGVVSLKAEPGYHAQPVWTLRFEGRLTGEVIDLARHVLSAVNIDWTDGYLLLNRDDAVDLAQICEEILVVAPKQIAYRPLLKYQGFNLLGHPHLKHGTMLFWELATFPRVPE